MIRTEARLRWLDDAPDPFTFMALPPEEREQFNAKRREKFKEWKRDDIVAAFQEHNHAIEAIITPDEQFAHPQLIANDMVATVVDPIVGETTQIGTPFGDLPVMTAKEALRTIAAFRLALPRTILRYAGGRELTLGDLGTRDGLLGSVTS